MGKYVVEQINTAAWSADTTLRTELDDEGLVTQIDFTAEVTPSASLAGTNQPDGLFRTIQNMTITGAPQNYFDLPTLDGGSGGTLLHYLNMIDGYGPGHGPGAITAPQMLYVPQTWVFHCGVKPFLASGRENPFDLTAFIPAWDTHLVAMWRTNGNDTLDDVTTISSAVGRFTVYRLTGSPEYIRSAMAQQGIRGYPEGAMGMIPAWSNAIVSPTSTTTSFTNGFVEYLPTGGYIHRIGMLAQNETADRPLRAADEATEVQLWATRSNEALYSARTALQLSRLPYGSNLEADDAANDFQNGAPVGVYQLDLKQLAGPTVPFGDLYGYNLINAGPNEVRLGFIFRTNASGDDVLVLHERLQPWMPRHGRLVRE